MCSRFLIQSQAARRTFHRLNVFLQISLMNWFLWSLIHMAIIEKNHFYTFSVCLLALKTQGIDADKRADCSQCKFMVVVPTGDSKSMLPSRQRVSRQLTVSFMAMNQHSALTPSSFLPVKVPNNFLNRCCEMFKQIYSPINRNFI